LLPLYRLVVLLPLYRLVVLLPLYRLVEAHHEPRAPHDQWYYSHLCGSRDIRLISVASVSPYRRGQLLTTPNRSARHPSSSCYTQQQPCFTCAGCTEQGRELSILIWIGFCPWRGRPPLTCSSQCRVRALAITALEHPCGLAHRPDDRPPRLVRQSCQSSYISRIALSLSSLVLLLSWLLPVLAGVLAALPSNLKGSAELKCWSSTSACLLASSLSACVSCRSYLPDWPIHDPRAPALAKPVMG
jgi:hypothetical protein